MENNQDLLKFQLAAYDPETMQEQLNTIYKSHDLPGDVSEVISETGFAIVDTKDGRMVGAAFLYTTNSPVSLIDSFVVSKELGKAERNLVIEYLLAAVTALAQEWGFKFLIAEPRFSKSERRLLNLGFEEFKKGSFLLRF